MLNRFTARRRTIITWPAALLFAGFAIVMTWVFATGIEPGEDVLFHIRTGEWIVSHLNIPRSDPWSWTARGVQWTAHEWGWGLLAWTVYRTAGHYGLLALTGGTLALFLWALHGAARARGAPPGAAAAAAMFAAWLSTPWWTTRPNAVSFAFWALTWLWTEMGRFGWPRWLLLGTAWANLHGGSAVLLPTALLTDAALAWASQADAHTVRGRIRATAAAATGTLLNPYGFGLWRFTWDLAASPAYGTVRNAVGEWTAPDFADPFWRTMLLAVLLAVLLRSVLPPPAALRDRIWASVLFMGTLTGRRYFPYLAAWGAVTLAPALPAIGMPTTPAWISAWARRFVVAASAVLLVLFFPPNTMFPPDSLPGRRLQAAQRIAALGETCWNTYGLGNYLIWIGAAPSIDARGDMYVRPGVFDEYMAALGATDEDPAAVLARLGVRCAAVGPGEEDTAKHLIRSLRAAGWTEEPGFPGRLFRAPPAADGRG